MQLDSGQKNLEIICAGIIVSDIFLPPLSRLPHEGELLKMGEPIHQVGGCAANTAIALSRLGKKTGIIGMVGNDSMGKNLIDSLIHEHINTNAIFKSQNSSTSQTIIIPVQSQDRRYIHYFGANADFNVANLESGINNYLFTNDSKIFILGGYLLMPKIESKELAQLLKNLKKQNYTIILDIAISSDETKLVEKVQDVLPFVDYFFPNDDEAEVLSGIEDPQEQSKCFLDWGVNATAITCGTNGVIYRDSKDFFRIEPYEIDFVDGSGAGDAFTAGMAIGISESWPLTESLKFGAVLGASVCQGLGCNTTLFSRSKAQVEMQKLKVLD
ncbi:MAG: carbohydrate kinase family protein [Candidatus Nanopelagicales bacterium]